MSDKPLIEDKTIGYIVIIVTILLFFFPVSMLLWQNVPISKKNRIISFSEVTGLSFLAIQDPVRIQGVEIGVVTGVEFKQSSALVTIETEKKISLYEDYKIQVMAKGIMGERYLTIMPGTPSFGEIPADALLQGDVAIGPDEALSSMNAFKNSIHRLNTISLRLKEGNEHKKSLIYQIGYISNTIDSLISIVLKTSQEIDSSIQKSVTTVEATFEKTSTFTATLTNALPEKIESIDTLLSSIYRLIEYTENGLIKFDAALSTIDDQKLLLWQTYESGITHNLMELRQLLHYLNEDSLTLPIRLW